MYHCAICDRPAVVALTGVTLGDTRFEFNPPEYRCQECRDQEADGADLVDLKEEPVTCLT